MLGGLYNRYGVAHEQVCWNIREEPKVIEAFARVWGTDDLLVSFGAWVALAPGQGADSKAYRRDKSEHSRGSFQRSHSRVASRRPVRWFAAAAAGLN